MPDQEPVISPEEPAIEDASAQDTAVQARQRTPRQRTPYEPIEEQDEWLEEPVELPRRPRRRLLSPVPLALLGVLLAACGFIAGVLVEKGQASSSSSAAGSASSLASRFAALRAGASGAARQLRRGRALRRRRRRDRRAPWLHIRRHAVRDDGRRQHRQGHDIGGHDRDEDRESRRRRGSVPVKRSPSPARRQIERRDQRRIDPRRRRARRRPRRAVRLGHAVADPAPGERRGGGGEPALFGNGGG